MNHIHKTITGPIGQLHLKRLPSGHLCITPAQDEENPTCAHVNPDELRDALDEIAPEDTVTGLAERVQRALARAISEVESDMDGGVAAALIENEAEQDWAGPLDETVEFWQARWKEAADQGDARDTAAHLWKDTARELAGRIRTSKSYIEALQGAVDQETARAEKAEQERGAALCTVEEHRCHEQAERAYRRVVHAEQPHPLSPDTITDEEQYEEGLRKVGGQRADHLDHLTVWLMGSEWARARLAPTRPEGAEELDAIVDRSIRGCFDITSPETVRNIADGLAEEGVRGPEVKP